MPDSIESREVCALSGQSPSPNCPSTIHDHAIKDVSRYETCELHLLSKEAVWPVRVEAFLRSRDAEDVGGKNELVITSPANGSAYLVMPEEDPQKHQRIPLTAKSGNLTTDLHWFVNDNYIGAAKSGETVFWPLSQGNHRVVCSDTRGASRSVRISVK